MHIYPKQTGPIAPETSRGANAADRLEREPIRPVPPTPSAPDRTDKVEISDAGRALAARDNDGDTDPLSTLDPGRASRIRDRILNGAYDTADVVDSIARKLLQSGDL